MIYIYDNGQDYDAHLTGIIDSGDYAVEDVDMILNTMFNEGPDDAPGANTAGLYSTYSLIAKAELVTWYSEERMQFHDFCTYHDYENYYTIRDDTCADTLKKLKDGWTKNIEERIKSIKANYNDPLALSKAVHLRAKILAVPVGRD